MIYHPALSFEAVRVLSAGHGDGTPPPRKRIADWKASGAKGSGMGDTLDEIISRHDAATSCGCSCCDDDFAAYADQKKRALADEEPVTDTILPESAASRRGSVRYVFETLLAKRRTTGE
ncbi:hypothetical protein [Ruegeria sp. EL01]|jgi:hypothetical protein|uniref:hypothetical protein n=1 Tax=Ruegeria sp. EL01 TaxID=2107578 RepID=UPI000EA81C3D|nr:hypothetical protein [Ruegeria sp. EL01]